MKKCKRSIWFGATFFFFFFGIHANVSAADTLYKCEYSNSTNTNVVVEIKADSNLSATVTVKKFENHTRNASTTINNWLSFNQQKTNIPASLWVPKKGCPKYLAVAAIKCSTRACDANGGFSFEVWANWDSSKSKNHCTNAIKSKGDGSSCQNVSLVGNPKPKQKICYYDNNNKKTTQSNSKYIIYNDAGILHARRSVPEDLAAGGTYIVDINGNRDIFLKDYELVNCPNEMFNCKKTTSTPGGRDGLATVQKSASYQLYASKELRDKDNACMKDVTDVEADINEEEAFKKGMTLEEWIEETEGPTAEECKKNPDQKGCAKNSCEVISTDGEVFKILKQILGYVQIGSVFAVLIFCVLDLGGAVASSDDDAFRKARGKVMKRIIALILIFLVPFFINFIINLVNLGACSEEDYDFIGNLFD